MEIVLCNRQTRRGTCHIPLRGGKCMTHDTDLAARNRKVVAAAKANDPARFLEQRAYAGHLGYVATGGKHGWEKANRYAIEHRKAHRSGPELWCEQVLTEAGYLGFVREHQVDNDPRTIDLAFEGPRVAIEINGHQDKPAFGETVSRAAKHAAKVAWLESLGWRVFVVHPNDDRQQEAARLLEWLEQFPLSIYVSPETLADEELPF